MIYSIEPRDLLKDYQMLEQKQMQKELLLGKDTYLQEKDNKLLMNEGQYNYAIMEYQKVANLLDSASNKPSKFRTRNWVEINDSIRGAYSPNKQIRFKTARLRSSLCDNGDAYILVKGNISVNNTAAANNTNKNVIFKNCAPFTNCIVEINNTQVDNAKDIVQ